MKVLVAEGGGGGHRYAPGVIRGHLPEGSERVIDDGQFHFS